MHLLPNLPRPNKQLRLNLWRHQIWIQFGYSHRTTLPATWLFVVLLNRLLAWGKMGAPRISGLPIWARLGTVNSWYIPGSKSGWIPVCRPGGWTGEKVGSYGAGNLPDMYIQGWCKGPAIPAAARGPKIEAPSSASSKIIIRKHRLTWDDPWGLRESLARGPLFLKPSLCIWR